MRLLLQLDVQNSKFETPLHAAVFHKNVPVVGWLLQAGASPNIFAEKGDTPLHRAAMMDQLELAHLLLKAGANPNLTAPPPNSMGRPIDLARNPQIVARLREAEVAQKRQAEMADWLRGIGLDKYIPTFLKDEWDLDSISMIDEKLLISMGLPPAPRLRFMKEIKDRADKQLAASLPKQSPTARSTAVSASDIIDARTCSCLLSAACAVLRVLILLRVYAMFGACTHTDSSLCVSAERKQLGQNTIIDYKDLKMGEMLGKGFFAEVRRAEWCGCKVAVKIIYRESFKNKSDLELFYQEAEILRYVCVCVCVCVCMCVCACLCVRRIFVLVLVLFNSRIAVVI